MPPPLIPRVKPYVCVMQLISEVADSVATKVNVR